MNGWPHLLILWAVSAVTMAVTWAICMRNRNVGYVEVVWAGLMTMAALYAGAFGMGAAPPRALVALFGGVWGARLCLHLLTRVLYEAEDARYHALRARWDVSPAKFFFFFQAVALFATPFLIAAGSPTDDLTPWSVFAIAIWLLAFGGETLADRQLACFRGKPANRGKVCRVGLWAWSRHPNYFFEWLHWFAYVALAIGAPLAWLSWLGPVVMLLLLYRVSIPWTEQQMLRSRGDEYRRYQREVSALIPWRPKPSAPA